VPEENLLGQPDLGFLSVGKETLEWERSCMIAPIIGGMQYMLETCTAYAKERKQFNRPISEFQAIQRKLVDMKVAIEAARLLVYRVAWLKQHGKAAMMEAAIAKLWTTEAAIRVSYDAVQVFGGYGYIQDYPVERFYRDARLGTIGAGTSEVQKMIIANELIKSFTKR
jgi:alkylation response protein AidB-like acyl-CoA dehydrogenase